MRQDENTEWRDGDIEGKTWCVYRWSNNRVEHVMNELGNIKRFRSRNAARSAARALNEKTPEVSA